MAYSLENRLIIGISTRALFDLRTENRIFEEEGVEAYAKYQREHETEILKPGPGFSLIKALLSLNTTAGMGGTPEKADVPRSRKAAPGAMYPATGWRWCSCRKTARTFPSGFSAP